MNKLKVILLALFFANLSSACERCERPTPIVSNTIVETNN